MKRGLIVDGKLGRTFKAEELKLPYDFNCSSCERELAYEKRFNHDGVRVVEAFPCQFCLDEEASKPNQEDMDSSLHAREVLVLKMRDMQSLWMKD